MSLISSKRTFFGILLGNLFEHYDKALYPLLVPFIAHSFFPNYDPISSLLIAYAIIPLGMLSRPLGALFFGYIGDTFGRKKALRLSLFSMACISGLMGLLPTYSQIGFFSPLLLMLFRIMQNFCSSGETIGGAIFLLESQKSKKKDLLSSFFNSSSVAGYLIAAFAVSAIALIGNPEILWRLLYGLGCLTGLFGWMLRQTLPANLPSIRFTFSQQLSILKKYWRAILKIAIASGFSYSCFSMVIVFTSGFVPLISDISKSEITHLNILFLVADMLLLPLFGALAVRFSRDTIMFTATLSALLFTYPLLHSLENGLLWNVCLVRFAFLLIGVGFSAPFHAWVHETTPREHRYLIGSLGYALGSQILGSSTPFLTLWIFQQSGSILFMSLYWITLALITATIFLPKFSKKTTPQEALTI